MPLNSALNRNIQIGLSFTSTAFVREVKLASDSLNLLEGSASKAQTAVSKIQLPGQTPGQAAPATAAAVPEEGAMGGATAVAARVGSAMTAVGPQIAAALQSGLTPLTQIGNVLQTQLNAVGGVITTLAAKIEGSMKMTAARAGLTELQTRIRAAVSTASAANQDSMTRLQRATLALGPAAATAIQGYKGFLGIKSFFGSLVGSTNQAKQSLQKLNGINLAAPVAGASAMSNQFRTMAPVVGRVTTSVKGLGVQIGLALGVVGLGFKATSALVGFFGAGIKGAIDLNETMNVVNVTFEEHASIVTETAGTLGSQFGLAKGVLLDAANAYGGIFQGAGMSTQASAELSAEMVKLAADVTSFKHIKLEDSLAKIQSALTGESKPLKDLGVAINENMIKQRAHTLGLQKGKEQLSEYAKTTAVASLISEKFTKASGDLERTQDAAANQFLRAGGGIKNFSTTIGTMLLPAVKVGISAFNELLASVITVFEENRPTIQTWADTVTGVFETTAMVLRNAGDYITIFQLTWGEKLANVLAYVETLPANLGLVATYISGNWREIIYDTVTGIGTIFQNLGTNLGELANSIYQFFKDPTGGFTFNWTPMLAGFQATAAALPQMIKPELVSMQDEIAAAGERIFQREKERTASMKLAVPETAKASPIVDEEKKKGEKYQGTAAAELGSKEAASSIAKFMNEGAPGEEKKVADNTAKLVKQTQSMVKALEQINARGGTQNVGLGTFTI